MRSAYLLAETIASYEAAVTVTCLSSCGKLIIEVYRLERIRVPSGHTTLNDGVKSPHYGYTTFQASAMGLHTIWSHHFLCQRQWFAYDLDTPLSKPASSQRQWFAYDLDTPFSRPPSSQRQWFAYDLVTQLSKPVSRVRIRSGHTTFKSSVKSSHTIWSHHFLSQHQGFAYDLVTPLSKPASRVRTTSCHPSL